MVRFHQFLCLLCLTFIPACGGGGGATVPTPPPPPPDIDIAEFEVAQDLLDTHADPVTYASPADAPTSGSAQFTGFAYGSLTNLTDTITNSLIGELTIDVAFASSTTNLSGSISNVVDEEGNAMTGALSLTSGTFDRFGDPAADSTVGISFLGTLTDEDAQTISIGGRLEGDFLGTSTDAIGGEFLGTVTFGDDEQDLNGGFVAER